MEGMTDINKLIKILAEIEKKEQEQYETVKALREKIEKELLDAALGGPEKPKEKKPNDK